MTDYTQKATEEIIAQLFNKLAQAEQQTGPRDSVAETQITEAIRQQPAAPYYMAQVIVVQEQALETLNAQLEAMQERVQQLEQELAQRPAQSGGFLGGLFGGGAAARPAVPPAEFGTQSGRDATSPAPAPLFQPGQSAAMANNNNSSMNAGTASARSPFMGSALQTAAAVAGGMVLGSMISNALLGNEAQADELGGADAAADPTADFTQPPEDDSRFWAQDDGGSDFDDDSFL